MSTPPNPLTSPPSETVLSGDGTTQSDAEIESGVDPTQVPPPE